MQLTADRLQQMVDGAEEQQSEETQQQQPAEAPAAQRRHSTQPKSLDDVSITRKVETELFRDPDVPKGAIDVNTADGVVWLRGEAKTPEMINDLEQRALEIPEVTRVENILHLPKTPAPSRADTFRREQKTRRSKPSPPKHTQRVTAEKEEPSVAEPNPEDLAKEHRGRPPSPLGSEGE